MGGKPKLWKCLSNEKSILDRYLLSWKLAGAGETGLVNEWFLEGVSVRAGQSAFSLLDPVPLLLTSGLRRPAQGLLEQESPAVHLAWGKMSPRIDCF